MNLVFIDVIGEAGRQAVWQPGIWIFPVVNWELLHVK